MPNKQTSEFFDMIMGARHRANDLVGAAADLADRYGITPANAAAWIAKNVQGMPQKDVERIRRNLQAIGSNRDIVEAGVRSNEARFRKAGGRGALAPDAVAPPVRLAAAAYKPSAVPAAVVREAPGALRAAGRYIQTSTPTSVAEDIGGMVRSGVEAFTKDPYGSVFNTAMYSTPQTIIASTPFDYAAMREASQMFDPYVKDDKLAARDQSRIDAISALPFAFGAPIVGKTIRKAVAKKRGGLAVKKRKY